MPRVALLVALCLACAGEDDHVPDVVDYEITPAGVVCHGASFQTSFGLSGDEIEEVTICRWGDCPTYVDARFDKTGGAYRFVDAWEGEWPCAD
jgi:hypothetical protein